MAILHGSCLCRGVTFEVSGPLTGVANCYCSICRKAHSAAFRTRARVRREHFRITAGEDLIGFHESSPDYHRGFCRNCGSPVYNWNGPGSEYGRMLPESLETVGIALASLDEDPGMRPAVSTFVLDKAPWVEITDDLPRYAATQLHGPPLPR